MGTNISKSKKLQLHIIENKQEAQNLLNNAEQHDFYLEECYGNRANSIARRNLSYISNTISLNDIERATVFINNVYSELPMRLLTDLNTVNIIQLMPSADGGMPHTRPSNIICYPDFHQLFSNTTLIHELWHIHQRSYTDMWQLVFRQLGWTIWNGLLPEQLEAVRRLNPDTIDEPLWIFNNKWVPIPIFRNITHPNIADIDIWFFNINTNTHSKYIPLEISSYFTDLPPNAYEHPREITAYMLSEPERYSTSRGFNKLLELIGHTSIVMNKSK